MKRAMTSINPPYSELILDGIKKIEWRTKPLPLGRHELYETKKKGGLGKVIGWFEVVGNIKFNLKGDTYTPQWLEKGCVPYEFLVEYAKGKDYLYANEIGRVGRYDKPKELGEFWTIKCTNKRNGCLGCEIKPNCIKTITRPPQSWCYVESLGD